MTERIGTVARPLSDPGRVDQLVGSMTTRRRASWVLVSGYYLAQILVGVTAWVGDPRVPPGHWIGDDAAHLVFGAMYAVLGAAALLCHVLGWRRGEAVALVGLGVYTVLHAWMLLAGSSLTTGARLMAGPLLMGAYALSVWQSVSGPSISPWWVRWQRRIR